MLKFNPVVYISLLILFNQLALNNASAHTANNEIQHAVIHTSLGNITIELYANKAPITVANFTAYIQDSAYSGGDFYRVVGLDNDQGTPPISVIQGRANSEHVDFSPIPLETTALSRIQHLDGTLSMARGGPDTATQEFFICIGAQPTLDFGGKRNPDGQGFAAFGRVINGMEIVNNIQQNRRTKIVEDAYVKNQILTEPVQILSIALVPVNKLSE